MKISKNVKDALRPIRDIVSTYLGYQYDFYRYFRYAGWRLPSRYSVRDYKAAKIYHRLEKSLSFRNRDPESGWSAADDLVRHLKRSQAIKGGFTFHEKIGLKVLGDFIALAPVQQKQDRLGVIDFWQQHKDIASGQGGVLEKNLVSLQSGKLADPEAFFSSRVSVRDFSSEAVAKEDIEKALLLALNTPSVCNRQATFVYCLNARSDIDTALLLQNGNRGFGHEIPCLLILCADLSAFDTAGERYQHWIDGGMFSMSIIWALHSLGLSSCCLNWSKGPGDDLKLRKLIDIKDEHTVLMMLAVGVARENVKVCYSARKTVTDFYHYMD
ncbi:nitroreductase family protein [Halopseudomonas pelagia]|uniref:nitroreductase family protein n=1 Tax=Halopseudomonas pelagia TaxID=553151 RepID=UPI00068AB69A|nr:nitroreductase family protein [Halopseudomonas pelagia]|tara:strand:- start:1184 stop:2164 length:981 start_codon:yes stop_codon:yes gene_type:complete